MNSKLINVIQRKPPMVSSFRHRHQNARLSLVCKHLWTGHQTAADPSRRVGHPEDNTITVTTVNDKIYIISRSLFLCLFVFFICNSDTHRRVGPHNWHSKTCTQSTKQQLTWSQRGQNLDSCAAVANCLLGVFRHRVMRTLRQDKHISVCANTHSLPSSLSI